MNKSLYLICILLLQASVSFCQVLPADGSKLHYRMIGFSWGAMTGASQYTVEVAVGEPQSEASFSAHVIKTVSCAANRMIITVPSFNKHYTWRVRGRDKNGKTKESSGLYRFSCMAPSNLDSTNFRFRITTKAKKYKNGLIFSDCAKAIYDMDGGLVWCMPPALLQGNEMVSDIKPTNDGTITFLVSGMRAMELSYTGSSLWDAPKTDPLTGGRLTYHHEFTKTTGGHYMAFSNEIAYLRENKGNIAGARLYQIQEDSCTDHTGFNGTEFTTLLEQDATGKTVWKWRLIDYFRKSDLNKKCMATLDNNCYDAHPNSFWFDEQHNYVYLSFRNANRILKIQYPTRNVVATYGDTPERPGAGRTLFSGQHSISIGKNNGAHTNIYAYNNNIANPAASPSVVLLQEPEQDGGQVKKIWELPCPTDGMPNPNAPGHYTRGGNVVELPDGSVFVSMNEPFSKVFIAGKDKKVVFAGIFETWNKQTGAWQCLPQYKASIITDQKAIERMVWGGE